MSPVEALQLALAKEKEAHDLYQRLAQEQPVARETFLSLVIEEEKHAKLIEKRIYELTK
jgi:rubrerythrin